MNSTAYFIFKILLSGLIVATSSWLAGRKPYLAGFFIALPVVSFISIIFTYLESRSMEKVNSYATSILAAVPLSLLFFAPFLLNRWLHLNFYATLFSGLALLFVGFLIHRAIFPGQY